MTSFSLGQKGVGACQTRTDPKRLSDSQKNPTPRPTINHLNTTMIGILTTIALAISFVDALPSLYSESEICRNGGDLCTKDDMKYELILPAQPGFQYVDINIDVHIAVNHQSLTHILFFFIFSSLSTPDGTTPVAIADHGPSNAQPSPKVLGFHSNRCEITPCQGAATTMKSCPPTS